MDETRVTTRFPVASDLEAGVVKRLSDMINGAYDEVSRVRDAQGIEPRLAAHAIAVSRVAEASQIRGRYP